MVDPAHAPGTYRPVQTWRILDTRTGNGAPARYRQPVDPHPRRHRPRGCAPDRRVASVAINLTATGATAGGYLTAYAAGPPGPDLGPELPAWPDPVQPGVVPVRSTGRISIYNGSHGTSS